MNQNLLGDASNVLQHKTSAFLNMLCSGWNLRWTHATRLASSMLFTSIDLDINYVNNSQATTTHHMSALRIQLIMSL